MKKLQSAKRKSREQNGYGKTAKVQYSSFAEILIIFILFGFIINLLLYVSFVEYDALARVIKQHPDRHETLK